MADPDGDALVVEHLADVVGVHAVDDERHGAAAVDGSAGPTTRTHGRCGEPGEQALGQRVLVGGDAVHAELAEVVDGRAEARWPAPRAAMPASKRCGGAA